MTKEDAEARVRAKVARHWTCPECIRDGAGHYCRLIPRTDPDYPHEYLRVSCLGNTESASCTRTRGKNKTEVGDEG